jgi:hypothetical protein
LAPPAPDKLLVLLRVVVAVVHHRVMRAPCDDPAVVLVVRPAGRVVVRQGRRGDGGEHGGASRCDQKTVHSLFLWLVTRIKPPVRWLAGG